MDKILQQVSRARRRLWVELFLNRVVRCLFFTLLAATTAIAVPKIVTIENLPAQWNVWWLGGAAGAALVAAVFWMLVRGRSDLDAAMEIDRRFGLRERVASSISLPPDASSSPAGKALISDAIRVVGRINVDEKFRIHMGRLAWLPIAPALVAVALVLFVDNQQAQSSIDPEAKKITKKQLDDSTKKLRELLKKQNKKLTTKELESAELIRELEQGVDELTKKEVGQKKALLKLNDLAKQLAERRDKLGGNEQLRKQLEGMKDLNKGPAEKMMQAMKQGDWSKAKQELSKLQNQLAKGELTEQQKKDMMKQLEQLKQKLDQAAAKRQEQMEQLKKQIEKQKKEGNLAKAGELQQKLDQMKKQQQQQQQMNKLAEQMAQCKECMSQGDQQGAAQAMQQMMEQMAQMSEQMEEGEMLEGIMDQLEMAKSAMSCEQCEGAGCSSCQGGFDNLFGKMPGNSTDARNRGPGGGTRSDEENGVNFRDSRVRQKPGRGSAVITGEADGPTMRGDVRETIKEQMTSEASAPADPLVIEQLPKSRLHHTEEYFNLLREGR